MRKLIELTPCRLLAVLAISCSCAAAGEADVLNVEVFCNEASICRFDVTVGHADEGWEHYANRWEVLSPDGDILATRELTHPHTNEQPFTRSLTNVRIPRDLSEVVIRAHDLIHAYGGNEMRVQLRQ